MTDILGTKSSKQSRQKQPDLSIVIPAYCEEKRIGKTLDKLAKFLKQDRFFKNLEVEVIVVAANAADMTHQIVTTKSRSFKNFSLLKPGAVKGKGRDVQYGMLRAAGRHIIYMDADLATPLNHLEQFYIECKQGSDLVVGARSLRRHHPNPLRRLVSNTGNVLFKLVSGIWIEDSQCGFKMFTQEASQICFSRLNILEWGFDMEILTIAKAHGLKTTVLRINDWQNMPYSTFNDDVIINSLRSLKDLAYILLNRIKGAYY